MRINSIGVMPQNNITNNKSSNKVAFKGFTSSISVEDVERAAKAVKGQKGRSCVSDEVIAAAIKRFKELTAKLEKRFGNDQNVDLHFSLNNQDLAASLSPGKNTTDKHPEAITYTLLTGFESNSIFADHGAFLQKIETSAKEITQELRNFIF